MLPEFKSIFDLLKAFPTEQYCIDHLERLSWNGEPVSPFDSTSKIYKCAGNKYKCKNTGKYFNVRTGSIFDNTKIPLQKWFLALYVFSSHNNGISSHQLAKDISVTQKSAWFLLHRLRYAFDHPNFQNTLDNVVEVDETFMDSDSTNKKEKNERDGTIHTQQPVLGMKGRNGNVVAIVVPNLNKETIMPLVRNEVEQACTIMTDEYTAYKDLMFDFKYLTVSHGAQGYVNHSARTNGIENFWSHLKRGIDSIFHWVSKGHFKSYVDEFTLRFNTRNYNAQGRFDLILSAIANKCLTYQNLIK